MRPMRHIDNRMVRLDNLILGGMSYFCIMINGNSHKSSQSKLVNVGHVVKHSYIFKNNIR